MAVKAKKTSSDLPEIAALEKLIVPNEQSNQPEPVGQIARRVLEKVQVID